jgi:hypothetical protein
MKHNKIGSGWQFARRFYIFSEIFTRFPRKFQKSFENILYKTAKRCYNRGWKKCSHLLKSINKYLGGKHGKKEIIHGR